MKLFKNWVAVPVAVGIMVATAGVALSEVVAVTSSSPVISLSGTSGGPKKDTSCAGYISPTPNHVVQVTEDTNLRFTLQSSGEPTLLIQGPNGQNFCVLADSYSNGRVEIPGRWSRGNYQVFVGDRSQGQHPYTLSISRN